MSPKRPKNTFSGVRGGKTKAELDLKYREKNRAKLAAKSRAYYEKNRGKVNAAGRAYYSKNKEKILAQQMARQLKRLYGLSRDDVRRMVLEQGGVCDLCQLPIPPESGPDTVVDHDHETGRVRGILHKLCNLGIGAFGDSIQKIRQAEKYLQKHLLKELSELGQEQERAERLREANGEKLVFENGKWLWESRFWDTRSQGEG